MNEAAPAAAPPDPAAEDPQKMLASEYSTGLPEVFARLGISLLVSTYQAHKLIIVRADGGGLNTHFRSYAKPMGLAVQPKKFALGTALEVIEHYNQPELCDALQPPDRHDACFVPRTTHVTGDIAIHEMAFAQDNRLWLVNTRFSCLCTLQPDCSFVPRWRPKFIKQLAGEDRCHLNGLSLRNGQPRYVTALGESDVAGGWRENKKSGGILMDLAANKIIARGLSMPHSPRWYAGRLWLLESGKGQLATVDPATGEVTTVAEFPGFTRGLDFLGPLAFVGLSQVRETATFSGIPITESAKERICGVWVVDIEAGEQVGFLRFTGGVQEVFAVAVLPGMRYPEILEPGGDLIANSFALPDEALKQLAPAKPPAAVQSG